MDTLSDLFADPDSPASLLVTHHVEEIPLGVTHCLLMSDGRITAAGPVRATLTGENLSRAFGMPLRVVEHEGRWSARSVARHG